MKSSSTTAASELTADDTELHHTTHNIRQHITYIYRHGGSDRTDLHVPRNAMTHVHCGKCNLRIYIVHVTTCTWTSSSICCYSMNMRTWELYTATWSWCTRLYVQAHDCLYIYVHMQNISGGQATNREHLVFTHDIITASQHRGKIKYTCSLTWERRRTQRRRRDPADRGSLPTAPSTAAGTTETRSQIRKAYLIHNLQSPEPPSLYRCDYTSHYSSWQL